MTEQDFGPVVEVAIKLDATIECDVRVHAITVVIDGKAVRADRYALVTLGHEGTGRTELRTEAWQVTRDGSQTYRELVDTWYGSAERNADNDFVGVAECLQPSAERAAELTPGLWLAESEPGSRTRRAAQAALAVAAYYSRAPHADALDYALEIYGGHLPATQNLGPTRLITSLLTDLRHLAEAYEIRLESEPAPNAQLARDLRALVCAIGDQPHIFWVLGTTFQDIANQAFEAFMDDCTTE
ncbi:hypothetical protein [Lentzea sp. CA-135723]|uniref:hypothetical protein n=1 Tax=Lentzea sp. CA-135723 TaxID=3239950 RepID=UPI003D8BBF52